MLTTSPRIHSSANASPSGFHYAPTRSSPQSPSSRLSASLTRRHSGSRSSSASLASTSPSLQPPQQPQQQQQQQHQHQQSLPQTPTHTQTQPQPESPQPQPRRYVAVDASTQYSPMEPTTVTAVQARHGDAIASTKPPTTPSSQPSAAHQPAPAEASAARPQQPIIIEPTPQAAALRQDVGSTLSPGKRRKSQDHGAQAQAELSSLADADAANAPKRQRPAPAPKKVLPVRYELGTTEDMVVLIAHMLSELIETNDALALRSGNLTRFHSRTAPSISVLEYLNRLAKHATLTPPLLLSMVYYIDRLCALYPEFTINTLTVHRFLITAATVAAKGLSDSFWNNTTYARVGGVKVAELKLLELEFLYRVDWKIVPNPEVLVAYYRGLVERCPGYVLEGDEQADGNGEDGPTKDDDDSSDISDDTDEEESNESPGENTPADVSPRQDNA